MQLTPCLLAIRAVCNAQQSFAKDFHFAHMRGTQSVNASGDTIDEDSQDDMMDFLLKVMCTIIGFYDVRSVPIMY